MKNYFKGLITGVMISAMICSIPAIADNIDALFNHVRININGVDQIQWDENIELADGTQTPSSILYNGTTYLPMRKMGELSGNKIYWNGDRRTVGMTGMQKDIEVIAEKPDKNGNLWKYYTFKDNKNIYLGVKDEAREYERVYLIANSSVNVTDNEIYFVRLQADNGQKYNNYGDLIKLSFENEPDSQDGEIITTLKTTHPSGEEIEASIKNDNVIFDGDYLYYVSTTLFSANESNAITVFNYITSNRTDQLISRDYDLSDMKLSKNSSQSSVLTYVLTSLATGYDYEITFDKITNTFSTPVEKTLIEE